MVVHKHNKNAIEKPYNATCFSRTVIMKQKNTRKGLETVNELFTILPDDKRTTVDYEYYGKLLIASNGIQQALFN